MSWLTKPAPTRHAYGLAATIGFVIYLLVLGAGHFLGTSEYWDMPHPDSRAYIMGYRYFLHEPWHWPPFLVHEMNVPYATSIAFTDSIPLWAAINKLLATIVPPWGSFTERSYLGLWHAICWSLQAVVGVANLRALGKRTYLHAVLTSLFFLAVPAFILRYGHAALAAHFFTLTALFLYFDTPRDEAPSRRRLAAFVGLLAAEALVSPYHVAMSFPLIVAALIKAKQRRTTLVTIPIAIAAVFAMTALAGYFSGETKSRTAGFELASSNLLSPFVPQRSALFGKLADIDATRFQYEGYAYLGLGVLVLLALFLPQARSLGAVIRRHPLLFAIVLGAWLFSLSNHVYLGTRRIFAFEYPEIVRGLTLQFRGPGRFVWLPTYVLLVFLLRWAFERFQKGWQVFVVPVLALFQIVDGGLGDWINVRAFTKTSIHVTDLDAWQKLVHAHTAVEIQQPYDCMEGEPPLAFDVAQEIQYLASQRALPLNGVYTARPTRDCDAERARRATLEPKDGTLYVLLPAVVNVGFRLQALGASCAPFNLGRVCTKIVPAVEAVRTTRDFQNTAPPLRLGEKISLGVAGNPAFASGGWSWRDPEGSWTVGDSTNILFRLEGEVPSAASLKIEANAALCGERTENEVHVRLEGKELATLQFTTEDNDANVARSIPLPDVSVLASPLTLESARAARRPLAPPLGMQHG